MASPIPRPVTLKLLEGRGRGRDGIARDSGGRKIPNTPIFRRTPPVKPTDLSADAAEIWDVFVSELSRVEVLRPLDGPALRVACETYGRWRQAQRLRVEKGILSRNSQGVVRAPWLSVEAEAGREFRAWCAEFGLTPSAEGRLGAPEQPPVDAGNPFAGAPS